MPESSERTALYRLYDTDGHLLYVGITVNPRRRWNEHRRDRRDSWWPRVQSKSVEWHPSRVAARAAERTAILAEHPMFNVLHSENAPSGMPDIPRPPGFGDASYDLARRHFGDRPFTTLDLFHVGRRSKSGTEQHVRELVKRELFIPVGHRVNRRPNGKPHTLFALAETPSALNGALVIERPTADDGLPHLPAETMETLACAIRSFGASGFVASELMRVSRFSRAGVRKQLNALTARELLAVTDHRVINNRGFAAKVFRVTPAGELAAKRP